MVPPQPISISSAWAPRQRIRYKESDDLENWSCSIHGDPVRDLWGLPHFPGGLTAEIEVFQLLLVLKSVHAGPEPLVLVCEKLTLLDQSLKGLLNQFFTVLDVSEDVAAENKKPAVHPN